jgi:hypothetical protein
MTPLEPKSKILSRRRFFANLAGRALTLAVAAAESGGKDRLVDRLLRIKDRINRRRRER